MVFPILNQNMILTSGPADHLERSADLTTSDGLGLWKYGIAVIQWIFFTSSVQYFQEDHHTLGKKQRMT